MISAIITIAILTAIALTILHITGIYVIFWETDQRFQIPSLTFTTTDKVKFSAKVKVNGKIPKFWSLDSILRRYWQQFGFCQSAIVQVFGCLRSDEVQKKGKEYLAAAKTVEEEINYKLRQKGFLADEITLSDITIVSPEPEKDRTEKGPGSADSNPNA